MSTRDESRPVRDEDAFDAAAVAAWLREHAQTDDLAHELEGTPRVRQFPGGASNLTYLLEWDSRDLILRRPPVGAKAKSAHDMGREHDIQQALAPVFPYVATMVGLCRDESVIGSEFYVMERLEGTIPRRRLGFEATPDQVSDLCGRAWDVLVDLHGVDVSAIPALTAMNRGEGYVARQVAGWTDRLARAATDDLGDWTPVTAWLDAHQPADRGQCLIHNDFRFDNLVLAPEDLARDRRPGLGDGHRRRPADGPRRRSGLLGRGRRRRVLPAVPAAAVDHAGDVDPAGDRRALRRAAPASRSTPEQWRFYEVFGLFRLAVIAQQIWYRYDHGQTHNEAYAVFGPAVAYLEQRCRRLLEL